MTTPAPAAPATETAPTTGTPAPQPQGDPANAPTAPEPKGDNDPANAPLGPGGIKALQAERDARTKAEQERDALRKQIADANKTAEEKAAEALKEAQSLAETNAAKALRYEVAAELGVPLAMAARLVGNTREEIAADAVKLKEILAGATTPPPTGGAPAAPLDQGARTTAPGQLSREELAKLTPAEVLDAARQGRLNQLLNPKG